MGDARTHACAEGAVAVGDGHGARLRGLEISEHVVGRYDTGRPGPLFLIVGGMHGNEPAGVPAILRVMAHLTGRSLPLRGRFVGLVGNLGALRCRQRYLDRDLNRMWADEEVDRVRAEGRAPRPGEGPEERARRELLFLIEDELAQTDQPVLFLDLHSTSAHGSPFSIIGDTLQNRAIAFAMPVPVILGLEETVDGALLSYFGERGHVAVGFEGGEHDDPTTVDHHEAAVWSTLVAGGGLTREEVGERGAAMRQVLQRVAEGLPAVVQVRMRHNVDDVSAFEMRPGYDNFDLVRAGDWLASDRGERITAAEDGRILLPLYQGQGQDGFFIGCDVRPFWLGVSAALRRLHLEGSLRLLPGVRRHPARPEQLQVDAHVARFWPVEVFHLFGYRKVRQEGERLVFSRRVERPAPGS